MAKTVPCGLATDCRSLYDLCNNVVGVPDERRVALDLLDIKEGLELLGDVIRWVPTEHMLADALTKKMPPDLFLHYLKNNRYSFKFDDTITNRKVEARQQRATVRKEKRAQKEQQAKTSPGKEYVT